MGEPPVDEAYYLEQVMLDDDDDDDFAYEEVDVDANEDDGDDATAPEDEDLEQALQTLRTKKDGAPPPPSDAPPRAGITRRPEVLDDFIRNVLLKMGMTETLDMFQREWYRLSGEGKLSAVDIGTVPDIYLRNQQLADQLRDMSAEMARQAEVANKAKSTWDRFRKERDFHKMHHKRVVQEKNKLIVDLKRLKNHYANFEPMLQMMRAKYETAMKEKMLMKLERDRLASAVGGLEAQLRQLEAGRPAEDSGDEAKAAAKPKPRGAKLPPDARENPCLEREMEAPALQRFAQAKQVTAHSAAVSSIAVHPTRPIIATAGDDALWKMWSLDAGELIMSGDGHKGWLSSVDFAPGGRELATGAEDGTVKIWDFARSRCAATLVEHTQAVWGVAYLSDCAEFVASCSMDHTAKLWDLTVGRCRQTFRGHVDSVNSVCFQPYANHVATASGDKTVSLWDCRSGLCAQTFYGHKNAVNSVSFAKQGDKMCSTDADGTVRVWDVRKVMERVCITTGRHPCTAASFDPSGKSIAVACDDAVVRCYDESGASLTQLAGHSDAVQCVVFVGAGEMLVTGSSDCTFRTWK